MLVSFLGSPVSGKTTIAAKVFAELKQAGQPNVEFVAEQARIYIAKKKVKSDEVILTNEDQVRILFNQLDLEKLMVQATGDDGVVVSDSSALNALWYMDEKARLNFYQSPLFPEIFDFYKSQLLFLANPLHILGVGPDALRIHTLTQSRQIHDLILKILESELGLVVKKLNGPVDVRVNDVVRAIYQKLGE